MATIAPSGVLAQNGAAAEAAAMAQRNRGIELMRASNPSVAIEAFEASLSIVESPNTRLDLGRALIATGRLASGLRELERARDTARSRIDSGQVQYARTEQAAAEEADAVRPRVPHLDIRFSSPPPPDTMIYLGSTRIPAGALLTAVPVDPGPMQIRLTGPAVRETAIDGTFVAGETATVVLEVSAPGEAATSAPESSVRPTITSDASAFPSRTFGLVAGGAGLVALTVGIVAWSASDAEYRALLHACTGGPCTGPDELRRANAAQGLETLGVTLMIAGGIVAAAGAVIVLVRGSDRQSRLSVSPSLAPGGAAVVLRF